MLSSLDVDNFAGNFLGLIVRYAKLSGGRDLCGITAYEDTVFLTECGPRSELLELKKGDVVLADYLKDSRYESRECRRRFTLAHECAHQIIYALGDAGNDYVKRSFRVTRVSRLRDNVRDVILQSENAHIANILQRSWENKRRCRACRHPRYSVVSVVYAVYRPYVDVAVRAVCVSICDRISVSVGIQDQMYDGGVVISGILIEGNSVFHGDIMGIGHTLGRTDLNFE